MNISSTSSIRNDYWPDYNGTIQLNQRIDNVLSTPFIRNDYWPDYNDINQLNQRIDDVENKVSLVNIRLSTDIENVSNNLNSYAKEQADTSISNNIIVNNLNANYAEGRFANFDNTFTNNAYVENLTVNKPVFDITLNTSHLENTTSLGGNFYNANLFDAKLSGDVSGNLNNVSISDLLANNANVSNLYVNITPTPIQSAAVLGYDSEGRVIPVVATYNVGFPGNADYLWTDQVGTVLNGVKATEVGEIDNLITAHGVKNAIDALNVEIVDNLNLVNDNLNNIYQWQNSFENSVANSFNGVANSFNGVANSFNDVANSFNTVNNALNTLVDTKLPVVTSLPVSPSNGETVLYTGTASGGLKTGGIYQYQISEWVLISYAESFTFNSDDFSVDAATSVVKLAPERRVYNGTRAAWDLLSVAEKTQYGAAAFTDDEGEGSPLNSEAIQLISGVDAGLARVIRYGKLVIIALDNITSTSSISQYTTIASGLPTPYTGALEAGQKVASGRINSSTYLYVSAEGTLCVGVGGWDGSRGDGSIVYVTND